MEAAGRRPWPSELRKGWNPGEDWDFDDAEIRQRYPRLWALYGWDQPSSP